MAEMKHGLSKHPLKQIWSDIKQRCYNKKNKGYKYYGERDIIVCDEWKNSLEKFYKWAISNGWKNGLTIERINVDGNYEPSNCKWIPKNKQASNRKVCIKITAFGETKTLGEWSKDSRSAVCYQIIHRRILAGWEPEDAISTPFDTFADTKIEAFGEIKSIREWSLDTRCVVDEQTLYDRIRFGKAPEWSISTIKRKKSKHKKNRGVLLTAFGETKSIPEWAKDKRCKVSIKTLYLRISQNIKPEDAMSTPGNKLIEAFGESKTLFEWSKDGRCTVRAKQLKKRLDSGMSPEQAISLPKKESKSQ